MNIDNKLISYTKISDRNLEAIERLYGVVDPQGDYIGETENGIVIFSEEDLEQVRGY